MPVRLQPAAPLSQVKHSTTEPLRSLTVHGTNHLTEKLLMGRKEANQARQIQRIYIPRRRVI